MVRTDSGTFTCFTRGKKSEVACGDWVLIEKTSNDQGVIASIVPRDNLVYRSDAYRSKVLAANVSLVVVVVATEPSFSDDLLGRALVCAETLQLPGAVVLNKSDLSDRLPEARRRLALYSSLGIAIHEISAKAAPAATVHALMPSLRGRTSLFLGQSGMGKSTLLNLLVPSAQAATREISEALHAGKHTTTDSRLYDLPAHEPLVASRAGSSAAGTAIVASIIDTPGFQEFGLAHLTPGEIERAFPDFRPFLGRCRFYNCTHIAEPGCAIRDATESGAIDKGRYALFTALNRESRTGNAS